MTFFSIFFDSFTQESCSVAGFLDCCVFRCCRTGAGPYDAGTNADRNPNAYALQAAVFDGHHHRHAIKYEGLMATCGLLMSFAGPYSARRHDAFITGHSGIKDELRDVQEHEEQKYLIYGDRGYANDAYVRRPHYMPTVSEQHENSIMASVRVEIEHFFGLVKLQWAIFAKLALAPRTGIDRYVPLVASLMTNAHICLNYCQVTERFACRPPSLEHYFSQGQ